VNVLFLGGDKIHVLVGIIEYNSEWKKRNNKPFLAQIVFKIKNLITDCGKSLGRDLLDLFYQKSEGDRLMSDKKLERQLKSITYLMTCYLSK